MALFFQATSLCVDKNDSSIVFAGVGPSICIIKDQKILKSQNLFKHYSRILSIQQYSDCFLAYAENYLLKLNFSYQELEFNILNQYELPDIFKAVDYSEENDEINAILGHGQIVSIKNDDSVDIEDPPNWKTITTASIEEDRFFYGDSFGTLTFVNTFDFETDYGTLFCICQKFDTNLNQILTAHEYKAAVLWNITDEGLECVWECKDFPSRVWGCNFFKGEPIIFSEDACVHYRGQIYQMHRSKTITALSISGDTIVTAGQYGTIRFSNFLNQTTEPQIFEMSNKQLITAPLDDGTCIVGTFEGNLVLLPTFETIYSKSDESEVSQKKGWFLISPYKTTALCFSRDKKLLFFSKNPFENDENKEMVNCVVKELTSTAVSIALNEEIGCAIMVDNSVKVFELPFLNEVAQFDISDTFPSQPSTIAVVKNGLNSTIAIGSLASVLMIEIDQNRSIISQILVDTNTSDDFISLHFANSTSLFCGGKSNGIVSIIEKVGTQQNSSWRLKTHWRVPWQLKSITQIGSFDNSPIVSALMKDSIVVWDIVTQTYITKFAYKGKKSRVSIQVSDASFTATWCDGSKVNLFSNSPCLSTKFVGPPFHGLRILSSASSTISNEKVNTQKSDTNLLITGSCDRDIRLWRVTNEGFEFLDCVYGSTDGTHSLCLSLCKQSNNRSSPSRLVAFSGGAKNNLIAWEVVNGRLFLLKEFALDQFGIETKVNFTVNCCALATVKSDTFLYLGCSDGFLNVFKYDLFENSKHIELFERKELKGTPMSIDKCSEKVIVAESTGDLLFIDFSEGEVKYDEVKISNCGILMVRLFSIQMADGRMKAIAASSCDDGKIILTDFENQTELLKFDGKHTGGIRSLCVNVNGENDVVSIASFSYDQCCVIHKVAIHDLKIIDIAKYDTCIFDGERVEYVDNNVVVLGSGMEVFTI